MSKGSAPVPSSEGEAGGGGLFDLERELSCSICTDILHLPLTLLDCLHTFCGPCLKEWFLWQATAARSSSSSSRNKKIYTCPSCRDAVRGTKADWRLATLLEGFLKANPGKGKTEEEKEELGRVYVPGEDILVPVEVRRREEGESEDEALIERVREASLANVGSSDTARRRARERERRRSERSRRLHEEGGRRSQEQEREVEIARQVEHQPSLRSLLGSETTSLDVQQEILASIYAEGLLDGIDIDNLTSLQEEELTERIAEAYRRRQRMRERSRNRQVEEGSRALREGGESPMAAADATRTRRNDSASRTRRHEIFPLQQQPTSRTTRPPISRPHLFDQTRPERRHRRSASSTGQRSEPSSTGTSDVVTSAARSATDLSTTATSSRRPADPDRPRPRAVSTNARSATDPPNMRDDIGRVREEHEGRLHPGSANNSPRSRTFDRTQVERPPLQQQHQRQRSSEDTAQRIPATQPVIATFSTSTHTHDSNLHAVPSHAAFAPEPVPIPNSPPSISCTRCSRPNIEQALHYTCSQCPASLNPNSLKGPDPFTLCLQCYRSGAGCHHWFGFGFAALHRWSRSNTRSPSRPHILSPQKWLPATSTLPPTSILPPERSNSQTRREALERKQGTPNDPSLLTGAFCDICLTSANATYWYCQICADGSWGYCHSCVVRGKHCTHPLLPLAHISALPPSLRAADPNTRQFVAVPHLKEHSWVFLPVGVSCDGCGHTLLPPKEPGREQWYHCSFCSGGDYDLCEACYLGDRGRGGRGERDRTWRRCERGHRMVVLSTQPIDTGAPAGQQGWTRIVRREMVGGWRLKEDDALTNNKDMPPPPDGGAGCRYLALYARYPDEGVKDELTFPRNAEIREAEDLTDEWSVGVFAGEVRLFPRNHCRRV